MEDTDSSIDHDHGVPGNGNPHPPVHGPHWPARLGPTGLTVRYRPRVLANTFRTNPSSGNRPTVSTSTPPVVAAGLDEEQKSVIDLVADLLLLAAATYAAKPRPIIAALKEVRRDVEVLTGKA